MALASAREDFARVEELWEETLSNLRGVASWYRLRGTHTRVRSLLKQHRLEEALALARQGADEAAESHNEFFAYVFGLSIAEIEGLSGRAPIAPLDLTAPADASLGLIGARRRVLAKALVEVDASRAQRQGEAASRILSLSGAQVEWDNGDRVAEGSHELSGPPALDDAVALIELAGYPHVLAREAYALLELTGAADAMLRSLVALRGVDAGFDPRNVLTMRVSLPEKRYETPQKFLSFFEAALPRIRALPGVTVAGGIDDLPLLSGSVQPIVLEGHAELLPRDQPTVEVRKIAPDYLKTMRIPILRGRDVAANDTDAMLVSRSAAKLLWGDRDPIGTRVTLPLQSKTRQSTIVGIVGDVKQGELSGAAGAAVYEFTHEHDWRGMNFAIRTTVPPQSIAPSAVAALRSLDAEQPIEQVRTMNAIVDETLTSQRFSALLLGIFAGVALVLASVGIFSVLSYIVRGRSREIGIRTALGAGTADVVRLVMVEGMTPALAGIAAGAVGVLVSAKLLQRMVYGVSGSDPLTLGAVSLTLALVALAASLVPAYRACRLDPLEVLRAE